jgi:hypothetical protein
MRVMFCQVAYPERHYALVARDDGVVYRLGGGPATGGIPHDLVHYTVEDSLGLSDGIWGAIAGGVVFRSMTHVSGRRPPHATDRSAAMIRVHRDSLQRAEMIGGMVEHLAEHGDADLHKVMAMALATRPELVLDPTAVRRAVYDLRAAAERWRSVPVGGQLTCHWPAYRKLVPPRAPRVRHARRGRVAASR